MATHPRGERFRVSEGDWVCQNKDCQNLNFARRDKCNKCGLPISTANQVVKMSGSEIGTKFAEKSKGLFSANDWQCGKCGNINWARRSTCNVCNAPKVGPDETRTGYGGGFKENDNVTYKEKEDSDGEFDEFGRKKKKFRGKLPEIATIKKDEKEKAYEIDDEEDDDDDDDEDVDLSKYALSSDDDDDNKPPPAPKPLKRSESSSSSSSSSSNSSSSSRSPRQHRSRSQDHSKSRSPRDGRSRSPNRSRSRSPHYKKR